MPKSVCSPSKRLNGIPVPYFSRAIIALAVASYFSLPASSGALAVKMAPHKLHRSFCKEYTRACSGAWPTSRTNTPGRSVS